MPRKQRFVAFSCKPRSAHGLIACCVSPDRRIDDLCRTPALEQSARKGGKRRKRPSPRSHARTLNLLQDRVLLFRRCVRLYAVWEVRRRFHEGGTSLLLPSDGTQEKSAMK